MNVPLDMKVKMFKVENKNAGIAVATTRLLDDDIDHFDSFIWENL